MAETTPIMIVVVFLLPGVDIVVDAFVVVVVVVVVTVDEAFDATPGVDIFVVVDAIVDRAFSGPQIFPSETLQWEIDKFLPVGYGRSVTRADIFHPLCKSNGIL